MYLAMSKPHVISGKEDEFEEVYKTHETEIFGEKGFKKFNLIKGSVNEEFSLYIFIVSGILKLILLTGQSQIHLKCVTKIQLYKKFISRATRF